MLNTDQRRQNYAYQEVARGGFDTTMRDGKMTPAQARRIRKKANKQKGDHPRSRRMRKAEQAKQALLGILERSRKKLQESPELAEEILQNANPNGKPLCPKDGCEPQAPDWACRTSSGKKTKDHAGRVR